MVLKPIQREKRNVLPKGLILKITHAHTHTSYLAIVMSLFYSCYILSHNNSRPSAKIGTSLVGVVPICHEVQTMHMSTFCFCDWLGLCKGAGCAEELCNSCSPWEVECHEFLGLGLICSLY